MPYNANRQTGTAVQGNDRGKPDSPLLTADPAPAAVAPDLQKQLAGLDEPVIGTLIPEAYAIQPDKAATKTRTAKDQPGLQAGFVLLLTGSIVAFALLFVWLSSGSRRIASKPATATPSPTPQVVMDESAELKSKLAFQDQRRSLQATSPPRTTPTPSPIPPPAKSAPPVSSPPPSAPRTVSYTPPPPAVRYPPATPATPRATALTPEPIDPFERWSQLASLGQSAAQVEIPQPSAQSTSVSATSANGSIAPTPPIPVAAPAVLPSSVAPATVHLASTQPSGRVTSLTAAPAEAELSPGARGILTRTPLSQMPQVITKSVTPGSTTAAAVAMPMIWDEGGANPPESRRFTVTLSQPMLAEDGTIALPAGTIFVVETSSVTDGNHLVAASAVAVIYEAADGAVKQAMLPAGAVLIRGEAGEALIAKKLHDPGGAIAGQDLLVGVLSSLGRVGEIINEPETQTVTTGAGFSQTSTRSNPQIWAAALEGFFGTTAERLTERSDQMVAERLARPNVMVVEQGTAVSVVVNSFFQVSR